MRDSTNNFGSFNPNSNFYEPKQSLSPTNLVEID